MSEWKLQAAKLTFFRAPTLTPFRLPDALKLYSDLFQSAPEGFQSAPNPLAPTVAHGKQRGFSVALALFSNRLDVTIGGLEQPALADSEPMASVADPELCFAEVLRIAKAVELVPELRDVARIALNLQLFCMADNVASANQILADSIPTKYRPQETPVEEFLLQINQPVMSKMVENCKLNIIIKWSAERFQMLLVNIADAASVISAGMANPSSREFTAAGISFDCNNVPRNVVLPQDALQSLFGELVETVRENLSSCSVVLRGAENV